MDTSRFRSVATEVIIEAMDHLVPVAQRIQTLVGHKGHVGRYADERFLVAVPNCEMSMLEDLDKQVKESAE